MAIGADRGFFNPGGQGLAVNAFPVSEGHVFVAPFAGFGNVGTIDPAGRVGGAVNIVRPVTVRTHGGVGSPGRQGLTMHRGVIRGQRVTLGQPNPGHSFRVGMALGAGLHNVLAVNRRLGVAGIEQSVAVAVAILAGGGFHPAAAHGLAVV
jgi:hypothetical protein